MDLRFECGGCRALFRTQAELATHEHACDSFLDLPFGEIAPTGPSLRRAPSTRRRSGAPGTGKISAAAGRSR